MTTALNLFNRFLDDDFFLSSYNKDRSYSFNVDIAEKGDDCIITGDLPGVKKEDLNIELKDNILTISAKKEVSKENVDTYYRTERSYGKYSRSFRLVNGILEKDISASYINGVVRIEIRGGNKSTTKKIEVRGA